MSEKSTDFIDLAEKWLMLPEEYPDIRDEFCNVWTDNESVYLVVGHTQICLPIDQFNDLCDVLMEAKRTLEKCSTTTEPKKITPLTLLTDPNSNKDNKK